MKRIYYWLGERSILAVWLVNLMVFNYRALSRLRSRYSDRKRSYAEETDCLGADTAAADHNDMGLNFYARLIVQYRYDFVIELGAYSLERSRWLIEHFPGLRVHALDITQDFREPRLIDGVSVGPNTLDQIKQIANGRGLVVAHGTLCYYPPITLVKLLALLKALQIDLAFSEPNTLGELSLDRSLKRTGKSYYHPYVAMLRNAGFTLPDNNGHQIRDCWGEYAETRTFLFARPSIQ